MLTLLIPALKAELWASGEAYFARTMGADLARLFAGKGIPQNLVTEVIERSEVTIYRNTGLALFSRLNQASSALGKGNDYALRVSGVLNLGLIEIPANLHDISVYREKIVDGLEKVLIQLPREFAPGYYLILSEMLAGLAHGYSAVQPGLYDPEAAVLLSSFAIETLELVSNSSSYHSNYAKNLVRSLNSRIATTAQHQAKIRRLTESLTADFRHAVRVYLEHNGELGSLEPVVNASLDKLALYFSRINPEALSGIGKDPVGWLLSDQIPSDYAAGLEIQIDAVRTNKTNDIVDRAKGVTSTVLNWASKLFERAPDIPSEIEQMRKVWSQPTYLTAQKFGTTVYFLAASDHLPNAPELPVDAKAIVIAFGGSGSARGSGASFMRNATSLRKYGIAVISLDYPYHGRGPQDKAYRDANQFMAMIKGAIDHYKQFGLPVYLLGHSFGDFVIQEILYRYPDLVRGAFMASPGGNQTPGLLEHYLQFRFSPAWDQFIKEHGMEMTNFKGEEWAEGKDGRHGVGGQFFSGGNKDLISTKVPVIVIRGENDPWNTTDLVREIAQRFDNGTFVEVLGADHVSVLTIRQGKESFITQQIVKTVETTTGIRFSKMGQKTSAREKVLSFSQHSSLFSKKLMDMGVRNLSNLTEAQAMDFLSRWEVENIQLIASYAQKQLAFLKSFNVFEVFEYLQEKPQASNWEIDRRFNTRIGFYEPELEERHDLDEASTLIADLDVEKRAKISGFINSVQRIIANPPDQWRQQELNLIVDFIATPVSYRIETSAVGRNIGGTYLPRHLAMGTQFILPSD